MVQADVDAIVAGEWASEQRALGRAIMVMGSSGRIYHADPQIATWLGRDGLGDNGFDLVPPAMAAEGAQKMNEHKDLDAFTVWFPMVHADRSQRWYRWDGRRIDGFLVDAIFPEPDTAKHHVHVVAR